MPGLAVIQSDIVHSDFDPHVAARVALVNMPFALAEDRKSVV